MMTPAVLVAAAILAALVIYALTAGADFGGGVWDLFASGPTKDRQRAIIANAIAPIWEANHVWLVLVVVLLFACFPIAFSTIGIALHVPLSLLLVGIVLRGSAFAFRSYDRPDSPAQHLWSRTFSIASTVTPVMLGVCVGAVLSCRIRVDVATGEVLSDFVTSWLAPFPFAIGLFALALCAFLAAVYLTLETTDRVLQRAFRARALGAAVITGILAWTCFALARTGAPVMHEGLAHRHWSMPFHLVTGASALAAIAALWLERYKLARVFAVLQVALVVLGWGFAQYPALIEPDVTIANAAAPETVLRAVLVALAAGGLILFPSLFWLYWIFKRRPRANASTTSH